MNKNNPIKAIDKINFTEQTKFRLSERKSHRKNLINMLMFLIT